MQRFGSKMILGLALLATASIASGRTASAPQKRATKAHAARRPPVMFVPPQEQEITSEPVNKPTQARQIRKITPGRNPDERFFPMHLERH